VRTSIEQYVHLEDAVNVGLMRLVFYITHCDAKNHPWCNKRFEH